MSILFKTQFPLIHRQMNALREVEPNSPELVDLLETKERAKGMSYNPVLWLVVCSATSVVRLMGSISRRSIKRRMERGPI